MLTDFYIRRVWLGYPVVSEFRERDLPVPGPPHCADLLEKLIKFDEFRFAKSNDLIQ